METFHFYQTGIKVATLFIDKTKTSIKMWNIFNGEWDLKTVLNEEQKNFLTRYLMMDIDFILTHLKEFEEFPLSKNKDTQIKTSWGGTYSKWTETIWAERKKSNPLDILHKDGLFLGLVTTNREATSLFIRDGYEDESIVNEWKKKDLLIERPYGVENKLTEMVPMRDGVHLATDIFLPKTTEMKKFPIIMARTPYGKERYSEAHYRFVQRGYAVVVQDVRGRNKSEGVNRSMQNERDDGDDTLNWLANQDWCDGEIGMLGGSYGGFVQWAAASSGNPHLKAMVSIVTAGSPFVDMRRKGGTLISGGIPLEFALSEKIFNPSLMDRDDWDKLMKIRPLEKIAEVGLGYQIKRFNESLQHANYDEYWHEMNWYARKEKINVPALIISGWYDDNGAGTTEAIKVTGHYPKGRRKIILGPWLHKGNSTRDLGDIALGNAALRYDIDLQHVLWFEKFLKHKENGVNDEPSVEYYTVNENKWKFASQWPPENGTKKDFYLASNGQSNGSDGTGKLAEKPILDTQEDVYDYDPKDPVTHLIDLSLNEICFPNNYQEIEKRKDILCYTTEPFLNETVITGQIRVGFYAKSTAVDTDWVVRLTDVAPDGVSTNLAEGMLCARFRDSFTDPSFLIPEKVYYYEMETSKISNQFKTGHRLRLDITSSAENYIFPHSNTENGVNSTETIVATQTILTGKKYPSKITVNIEKNSF